MLHVHTAKLGSERWTIDVSYVSIARAIDRCAWAMEDLLGKGADFTAIATYLNPEDLRHVILFFGVTKVGYKHA